MGWLQMSKQELRRVEVLIQVLAGRRTMETAAGVLGVSLRQAQRLLARYRAGGSGAMVHRPRGWLASNRLGAGVQEYVLGLVRQNFRDFGPALAAEALLKRHGVEVSRETLRKWMVADRRRPEAGTKVFGSTRLSSSRPVMRTLGPTLATEVLLDKHELRVGRETLRLWMLAEGRGLSHTQRRTFHQPLLRRESSLNLPLSPTRQTRSETFR